MTPNLTDAEIEACERANGVCLIPREGAEVPSCHETSSLCCHIINEIIQALKAERKRSEFYRVALKEISDEGNDLDLETTMQFARDILARPKDEMP